jgi:PAS domain S-box-containing protein
MQSAPTIVIVDDAAELRALVRARLRLSGLFDVVGEGANGEDAVALAERHRPQLMLLDVSMPETDGLEALPRILAASPGTRVVLYSGFEEQGLVEKARDLGAAAFIEKSASAEEFIDRLLRVADPAAERRTSALAAEAASLDAVVLEEHLERFREVFDEAAIGMATMTLTGRIVRGNAALARLVRRSEGDLVGCFYGDLTDGAELAVKAALDDVRLQPLDVVQLEHGLSVATDDRRVQATFAPVRDSSGRPLYLFLQVQDVTSERAAVEELRRSEERFRLLVEAVEDYAIFMLDPTGRVMSWNSGAQRSKGYTVDEIVGQHFRIFYPLEVQASEHPEHELDVALREGHYEEEGWRVRKDGSRFWASVLITAVYNQAGTHVGFAKVTRDSTDRQQLALERERAAQALAEANRELESLNERLQQAAHDQSQFLAVTAHELRTPLGVLGGSAEMLSQHWSQLNDEDRTDLFDAMAASTTRLRRLLTDLLTASRLQASALEMQAEPVQLSAVVADAVHTLERTQASAEILVEVPDDLVVSADRGRLAQALDNLLGNALRHGLPPIRVSTAARGGQVELRVSDRGSGVVADMAHRLFERFATGSKGGTGLGLFIVRELARAQGGDAFYEPPSAQEPAGTFVISLPRAVETTGASQ